ncbi:C-signal-like isoform X2 [Paroedura picta]|uniref:C-signal-like isoform X2 n=1 Tax=Paroedura picta TaxID=143630 RepID=UPI0040563A9D
MQKPEVLGDGSRVQGPQCPGDGVKQGTWPKSCEAISGPANSTPVGLCYDPEDRWSKVQDVTDLESIRKAVEQVQGYVGGSELTLLVNNAALRLDGDLETESAEHMAASYAVNTIGPHQVSQAFLPLLKTAAQRSPQQGLSCSKAAVVNISSAGGSIELMMLWEKMQRVGYRCSKAALNMLTKCQSLVYQGYGILCVCIHPGWVKTGTTEADLTEEESTRGIVHVLAMLSEKDNGTFVDWEGNKLPW